MTGNPPSDAASSEAKPIDRPWSGEPKAVRLSEAAEDIAAIPDSDWVVISGKVRAVHTGTHEVVDLFPLHEEFDEDLYGPCPGPFAGEVAHDKAFSSAGINIRPGANGVHTLYTLHRSEHRSTVQVFEIGMASPRPTLTWVGGLQVPQDVGVNGIAYLPANGLVLTNFLPRSYGGFRHERGRTARESFTAGRNISDLWAWTPSTGWYKVPDSEGSGLNGIEASRDGKWIYANEWATGRILRFANAAPGQRGSREVLATLDFHPDNMRWQADGTLLVVGQGGTVEDVLQTCLATHDCSMIGANVISIEPHTRVIRKVVENHFPGPGFALSTGGTIIGRELWVSGLGADTDRLLVFPLS